MQDQLDSASNHNSKRQSILKQLQGDNSDSEGELQPKMDSLQSSLPGTIHKMGQDSLVNTETWFNDPNYASVGKGLDNSANFRRRSTIAASIQSKGQNIKFEGYEIIPYNHGEPNHFTQSTFKLEQPAPEPSKVVDPSSLYGRPKNSKMVLCKNKSGVNGGRIFFKKPKSLVS